MEVTKVKIFKNDKEGKVRAYAHVTFDDELVIKDIKIIEGHNGLFVGFPSKKVKDEFTDICFPISKEARAKFVIPIMQEYEKDEPNSEE